ncbi:M14 family metallopeptidase [Alkalihalophilus marmarensis]|uniref:M14 family metallopeptidase n=1 Tax=Alkalihalophilus marmarensis TaxID=521377 RepID=UPI002042181E|nr:M14 family metallopeptidase [Alkalihalophilus marmarensis]MCM3490320.1 M14 family metallopeptidase [Alkalihalophilus marmarensis]
MLVRVRRGDNLWYYSQLFRLPLQLVIDSNGGVNPNALQVGALARIPGYTIQSYTIQSGDTFWTLSREFGLPIDSIFLLNQQTNPTTLQVGTNLHLPRRVPAKIADITDDYRFSKMTADLDQLSEIYPFIRRRVIGRSVMGKPIEEIKVGNGPKRVHLNGSFHAHEWITTPVLVDFLNEYLLAMTNQQTIREIPVLPFYNEVELSIVAMVNPDGVDLVIDGLPDEEPYRSVVLEINNGSTDFSGWRANIKGVDLNNQYPANWEEEAATKPAQPAPRDFPGYAPLTEPESIAIAELTIDSDFSRVLAFHTQGEVIFWGFQRFEPPESEVIVEEFARVSGFRPIQYVDSYAGYKDWFIEQWRRPGYTVELGLGENPLPFSDYPKLYEDAQAIILASLYM